MTYDRGGNWPSGVVWVENKGAPEIVIPRRP